MSRSLSLSCSLSLPPLPSHHDNSPLLAPHHFPSCHPHPRCSPSARRALRLPRAALRRPHAIGATAIEVHRACGLGSCLFEWRHKQGIATCPSHTRHVVTVGLGLIRCSSLCLSLSLDLSMSRSLSLSCSLSLPPLPSHHDNSPLLAPHHFPSCHPHPRCSPSARRALRLPRAALRRPHAIGAVALEAHRPYRLGSRRFERRERGR